jgi:hypothetical protein
LFAASQTAFVLVGPSSAFGPGQDVAERCARAERGLELVGRLDLDDLHARRAQRRVVDVAGVLRDDALVLREAAQVGSRTCRSGLPPVSTRPSRGVSAGGAAAVTMPHSACVSSASALADGLRQLVQVHVVLRGRLHRGAHFGQRGRSVRIVYVPRAFTNGRTPIDW